MRFITLFADDVTTFDIEEYEIRVITSYLLWGQPYYSVDDEKLSYNSILSLLFISQRTSIPNISFVCDSFILLDGRCHRELHVVDGHAVVLVDLEKILQQEPALMVFEQPLELLTDNQPVLIYQPLILP